MMTFLANLNTRMKLLLGLGLLVALMAVTSMLAWQDMERLRTAQKQLLDEQMAISYGLMELRAAFNRERAALATLGLAEAGEQGRLHAVLSKESAEVARLLQALKDFAAHDTEFSTRLNKMLNARSQFTAMRDSEVIPLLESGKRVEAGRLITGALDTRFAIFRELADDSNALQMKKAEQTMRNFEAVISGTQSRLVLAIVAAIVIGVLMVYLLDRAIARPLHEATLVARRIANGDLGATIPGSDSEDEVGQLLRSLREMVETWRHMVGEINRGILTLSTAAEEISGTTARVSSGAAQSAAAISETTATVEEVKQTALLSSQKARSVSEAAQVAAETAQTGRDAIDDGMRGMTDIQQQMESIAQTIVQLSERSQAIGEIIATVGALAEQSNLLAVNAAIEAAKAGEHGKGFGVVAQEVKNLADQSRTATRQVRQILTEIEKAVSAAVMTAEQGARTVTSGADQVTRAGDAIRSLAEAMSDATHAAAQISASSQQQLAGMDQVATAMDNIKQVSNENVAGARQSENLARELDSLSRDLRQVSGRFSI